MRDSVALAVATAQEACVAIGGIVLIERSALWRIPTAMIAGLALMMALAACGQRQPGQPETVLRRGLGGDVSTLDPQKAGDSFSEEVIRDLFEGLTSEAADGSVVPALAESWAVTDDGRTYTFALRRTARWSNGDPVTADDVVLGMRRALDPTVASPAAALLRPIEHANEILGMKMEPDSLGVSAHGPYSVVIHLTHATSYLPMLLARCVAFPLHGPSMQRFGDRFVAQGNLVSNGPYRLEAIAPNTKISLVRNPYYWDSSRVATERVEHYVIADAAAELLRYRANGLDMTSTLPAARFDWARQEFGPELQVRPQLAVVYLAFNMRSGPLKDAAKLREALSLAIDREALTTQVLRAGQVPAYSFVPPGIPGYTPVTYAWQAEARAARLSRARQLYRESGYFGAKRLSLRLLHSDNEAFRNTALTAAAAWKEVFGIDVELEQREFKTFLSERAERGKWDVLISGWGADIQDPSNFLNVFLSTAAANDPGLADPEYDRILNRAESEPVAAERLALLAAAERKLIDSYAIAPVYYPVLRRLVKPFVQGAALNPMGHNYSKSLRLTLPSAAVY
jgi:oligopeptide transport system substrate-binding protein